MKLLMTLLSKTLIAFLQIDVLMWKQVVPWLALLSSLLFIAFQRVTISNLQKQLLSPSRSKRSIDDNSLYVPVFAQISKKAMKRLCRQQSRRNVKHELTTTEQTTIYRKKCSGEVTFSPPRLIAKRPHSIGSAVRDGDQWFLTEYHLGYNILQFLSTKNLNQSSPHEVYTLPYAFQGTDMIVLNGTIFFNSVDDVVSYNFKSGSVMETKLPLAKLPIYKDSASIIDIQAEEHGLWTIYRKSGEKSLTVRRMVPSTLKVVTTWHLQDLDATNWCNSFIRCGILYSVVCGESGLRIQPIYDFYQNVQVGGKSETIPGIKNVSTVQYDQKSRSVVIFSQGNIFSFQTF